MRRYIMLVALAVAAAALAAPAFAGGGKSSSDAIWIVGPTGAAPVSSVKYGATFEAGYSTGAKAPVGLVECWANSTTQLAYPTSGVIWSGYRFPQADGNIGLFTLSDPL